MELIIGGLASSGAGIVTNPLEVIKTRIQLQGELKAKGNYVVHYRNVFHACVTIAKKDGVLALQKGLVPAFWYQFVVNGIRLGTYEMADNHGLTRTKDGKVSSLKALVVGAGSGIIANVIGSPFSLIKIHLQSKANESSIAVGYQHNHQGMNSAFKDIYTKYGILGLWRGTSAAVPRLAVGSSIQLLTFEKSLEFVRSKKLFNRDSLMNAVLASLVSGFFVTVAMAPFDLVATRFYNQGVDVRGKGLLYNSIFDCAAKILREEGGLGFFKGWTANYFRLGPYTLLSLVFWDRLKLYHKEYKMGKSSNVI